MKPNPENQRKQMQMQMPEALRAALAAQQGGPAQPQQTQQQGEQLAQVVDPTVSHSKFEEEVEAFESDLDSWRERGVFIISREFPEVLLAFVATQAQPYTLMLGAHIDFTDYDHSPPSVRLVNPFTGVPYQANQLPTRLPYRIRRRVERPDGSVQEGFEMRNGRVQHHQGSLPFVCIRGVREYHEHPAHTGDSWFLHRTSQKGTLTYIAEQIRAHATAPVNGLSFKIQPSINLIQLPEADSGMDASQDALKNGQAEEA